MGDGIQKVCYKNCTDAVINMTIAQQIGADCEKEINCGLPLRWHKTRSDTYKSNINNSLLSSEIKLLTKRTACGYPHLNQSLGKICPLL